MRKYRINTGPSRSEMMRTEAELIKNVDEQIRKFIGGTDAKVDEIFSDTERYRRMADMFWKKEITGKAAA